MVQSAIVSAGHYAAAYHAFVSMLEFNTNSGIAQVTRNERNYVVVEFSE